AGAGQALRRRHGVGRAGGAAAPARHVALQVHHARGNRPAGIDGGAVGRLWTSSIAIGRQHGLTLQVFGEKGGLSWQQEHPNQLKWMPLNGRLQIIERGEACLSPEADRSTRVTIGHAEGMPLAFANIYKDLAEAISAQKEGRDMDVAADLYPRAEDGLRSMAAVFAVAESGKADGAWVDARPPMFRS
ncbi:MAG: Gfo/Idh/MocA family oxidoreductase, partial [Alphaproteobacteria bacterium]|nr:Gfo/Idh/MocA family oxidoreductase [Alphaproteobacteria bacterium]